MAHRRKGYATEKILKITEISAVVLTLFTLAFILFYFTNILSFFPCELQEILGAAGYLGNWGGPVLSAVTLLLLLILKIRTKSLENINKILTVYAVIIPPLITASIMIISA